jgi:aspartyl-tRNA(Asn)/glutamyl-tRNA(Gln) amidotransferase subunit A
MTDLTMIPAAELAELYRRGDATPVEATKDALAAIDRHSDAVNAFVLVDADGALESARKSEQRWRAGDPLGAADGIPTSIKDILLTAGWPTLRGSLLIDDAGPWTEDAPAVARLREGGAVLLGKTTTPEFAWKGVTDSIRHGVTGNPWGADQQPGGSSGGSATAVGLGMGSWSVGTDGGGSVRIPASLTSTVALKPTYGLIPLYPASPFGTLSHAGPMTRTVRDAAILLDVLAGFDARDPTAMPTPTGSFARALDDGIDGLRIAFSPDLGFVRNDPEVDSAVRAAVAVLEQAGARVEQIDPGFTDPVEALHVLWFAGVAKVLDFYPAEAIERIDPLLRRSVEQGRTLTASDFLDAGAVRTELGITMARLHTEFDLLVTPTLPIAAFPTGRDTPAGWHSDLWTSWTPYTYPFNLTGQPALSVPCGFTADERPIGLQLVGARHADELVLRAGHSYQQRTDWSRRVPTLHRTGETSR